jgi:hypothetical protein
MNKVRSNRKSRTYSATRSANLRPSGRSDSAPPTVSAKWLLTAIATALAGALVCAWGTLCFLFWQGNWQLMYRPASAVTRTPASVNLNFDSIEFATNAAGEPQLRGWWIPASPQAHYTAIYLHGADGNLGDTVPAIAQLHAAGMNVFAFDYRGYGQSHFAHPSEARWRQDADSAIAYLTGTRHTPVNTIILVGKDLGANLAVEAAAAHPDIAGVVLEQPLASPTLAIFSDARARLVPAHWLVSDHWQTTAAAGNILVPSLWFYWTSEHRVELEQDKPEPYDKVPARKMLVWLTNAPDEPGQFRSALSSWLDQLLAVSR